MARDAWQFYDLERGPVGPLPPGPSDLPPGPGVGIDLARRPDGRLVVVWYDRSRTALRRVAEGAEGVFEAPVTLDGEEGPGGALEGDRGSFPALAIDGAGNEHVTYVDGARGQLLYLQLPGGARQVLDDGIRTDPGGNVSVHRVGADSRVLVDREGVVRIFYQDQTGLDLVEAHPLPAGGWSRSVLAGGGDAYLGAFGFYIDAAVTGAGHAVVSYRIDRQAAPPTAGLHLLLR
jgi:hypothetical protein